MGAALAAVDQHLQEKGHGADQPIFWRVFSDLLSSRGRLRGPWGFRCVHLCGRKPSCDAPAGQTLEYCGMDPFIHPTGWDDADKYLATIVSYHANWAASEGKIGKLKKVHLWNSWVEKAGRCRTLPPAEWDQK